MEKTAIYQKVVDTEVRKAKLECEEAQTETEIQNVEEDVKAKQKQIQTIEQETKTVEAETNAGNDVLIHGEVEISEANTQIEALDKEVVGEECITDTQATVTSELHDRNDTITSELEALAVHCEDLEDKVNEDSKGRIKEQYDINQELREYEF